MELWRASNSEECSPLNRLVWLRGENHASLRLHSAKFTRCYFSASDTGLTLARSQPADQPREVPRQASTDGQRNAFMKILRTVGVVVCAGGVVVEEEPYDGTNGSRFGKSHLLQGGKRQADLIEQLEQGYIAFCLTVCARIVLLTGFHPTAATSNLAPHPIISSSSSRMSNHAGYGEKAYWDVRYGGRTTDIYEWYMPWATLKAHVLPHIHAEHAPAEPHKHVTPLTLQQVRAGKAPASGRVGSAGLKSATGGRGDPSAATASAIPSINSAATSDDLCANVSSSAVTPPPPPPPPSPCPQCLSARILIAGCGNSELSAHLWQGGFHNLISVDYSDIVISKMKSLYAASSAELAAASSPAAASDAGTAPSSSASFDGLAATFHVGDCRDLRPLACCKADESFQCILDKGTLDAILCGNESNKSSTAFLAEMHRLLRPGGALIVITYGQPSSRLPILERKQFGWRVEHVVLGVTRFMYVCRKKASS
jgi:SAM-dependent methyltransferase